MTGSRRDGRPMSRTERSWRVAAIVAVTVGVAFAVVLISVSAGVSYGIRHQLAAAASHGLLNVSLIDRILVALTVLVAAAMLAQTAISTFVLGVTAMRSRREEIAIRRQSGVLRSTLVIEFTRAVLGPAFAGGLLGEAIGVGTALFLRNYTVLEVRFTVVSLLAAFPVTVILSVAATIWPAWQAANVSPALLRRE